MSFPSNLSRLAVFTALASATLLISGCHAPAKSDRNVRPRILVYQVTSGAETGAAYSGTIHSRVEQDLSFRVGGRILERKVNVGDRVTAGQLLMRLDPADYDAAMGGATAAVSAAQAQATRANASYERLSALAASGSTAPDAIEQARAAKDSADANLKAAQAQLVTVRNQRAYTELRADGAGIVTAIPAEAGQVAGIGQPVIRVAMAGPPEAVVGLPDAGHAPGEAATVTVFGSQASTHSAHLRQISAAADPSTRLFEARYVLDATLADAPLGSTVTVAPSMARASSPGLDVPLSALVDKGEGTRVWTVDAGGRVRSKPVKVLRLNEETASIAGGLSQGDVIVAAGAQLLHEGEVVTPVRGGAL
jgi:RND family efflux transporter MFP subunit